MFSWLVDSLIIWMSVWSVGWNSHTETLDKFVVLDKKYALLNTSAV